MIVISDTTPLISLMKIGQLSLLNKLFGEVLIPSAVFDELVINSKFPDESRQIRECPFIKRVNVTAMDSVKLLRRSTGLDAGESEAIILSDSFPAFTSYGRSKRPSGRYADGHTNHGNCRNTSCCE